MESSPKINILTYRQDLKNTSSCCLQSKNDLELILLFLERSGHILLFTLHGEAEPGRLQQMPEDTILSSQGDPTSSLTSPGHPFAW